MERKIKVNGLFKGCTITGAGLSRIKVALDYEEIENYIKLIAMQGIDLVLAAKDKESKFKKFGIMRLKSIDLKGIDGALLTFVGDETVNVPVINMFINQVVNFLIIGEVPDELEEEDASDE